MKRVSFNKNFCNLKAQPIKSIIMKKIILGLIFILICFWVKGQEVVTKESKSTSLQNIKPPLAPKLTLLKATVIPGECEVLISADIYHEGVNIGDTIICCIDLMCGQQFKVKCPKVPVKQISSIKSHFQKSVNMEGYNFPCEGECELSISIEDKNSNKSNTVETKVLFK
jgi:hypothetical protein